jgi:hypothetical protein
MSNFNETWTPNNKEKNDKVVQVNLWKILIHLELSQAMVLFSNYFETRNAQKETQAHLIKDFNPTLLTSILIMLFIKILKI